MMDILLLIISVLSTAYAHQEVHVVPAHVFCPSVTEDHDILLPSPIDCSVYYRCENGMAVPQSCPEGLEWCKVLSQCTLPMLANCTISHTVVTYSPEELATYNPNAHTTEGTTTTESDDVCPFEGAMLPNPLNCSQYYTCKNGEAISQSCPSGEEYSCWDQMCVSATSADCINSGNQEGHACSKTSQTLPTTDNCTTYYKCVNGQVVLESCAEGTYYSPWYSNCTSDNTDCEKYLETSTTTTEETTNPSATTNDTSFSICPFDNAKLPNPSDCTSYYICENQEAISKSCPTGEKYSCWDQMCEPDDIAECISGNQTGHTCSDKINTMPHIEDCSSYYKCVNGIVKLESCPTGLSYSPWHKDCRNDNSCEEYKNLTSSGASSTSSELTTNPSKTSPHSILCPRDGLIYPSYKGDCQGYMECVDGQLISKKCDPPTYNYNCETKKCENITHCCATGTTTMSSSSSTASSGGPETEPTATGNTSNSSGETENTSSTKASTDEGSNPSATTNTETSQSGVTPTSNPGGPISTETSPSEGPFNPSETTDTASSTVSSDGTETEPSTIGNTSNSSGESENTSSTETSTGDGSNPPGTTNSGTSQSGVTTTNNPGGPISTETSPSEEPSNPSETTGTALSTVSSNGTEAEPSTIGNTSNSSGESENTSSTETSTGEGTNPSATTNSETSQSGVTPTSNPGGPISTETSPSEGPSNPSEATGIASSTVSSDGTETEPSTIGNTSNSSGESENTSSTETSTGDGSNPSATTNSETSQSGVTTTNNPGGSISTETSPSEGPSNPSEATGIASSTVSSNGTEAEPSTIGNTSNSSEEPENASSTETSTGDGSNPSATTNSETSQSGVTTTNNPGGPISTETSPSEGPSNPSEATGIASSTVSSNGTEAEPSTIGNTSNSSEEPENASSTETSTGDGSNPSATTNSVTSQSGVTTTNNPGGPISTETSPSEEPSNPSEATGIASSTVSSNGTEAEPSTIGNTSNSSEEPENASSTETSTGEGTNPSATTNSETSQSGVTLTINPGGPISTLNTETSPSKNPSNPSETTSSSLTTGPSKKPPSLLCPRDGIIYPSYKGDCQGYMECVDGQLISKKCDPPTYNYNCETKQCENITHCCATGTTTTSSSSSTPSSGGPETEPTATGNTSNSSGGTENTSSTTTSTGEGSNSSPTTNSSETTTTKPTEPTLENDICPEDGAKLPNAIDCTSYYVCQNNNPTPEKCPDGEEYSCWDQACKKPKDSTCIKEGSQQGHPCSNEGGQNKILDDCSSYYKCKNGRIEIVKCAAGTFYNSWFKACYNLSLAWCTTYPTIPPTSTIEPPPSTSSPSATNDICPEEGAKLPNVLDCNSYYVCVNGTPTLQNCHGNQVYSCWDQECKPVTEGNCIFFENQPGANCSINGLQAPNINDCSSYLECRNHSTVAIQCPDHTKYNSWFKRCVKNKYAHCQTVSTPAPTGRTSTTVSTTETSVSPSPDVCPEDGAQLPDPSDCSAYYVCKKGKPVPKKCPKGQEYSCWDQKCELPSINSTCIRNENQEGHSCSINGLMLRNVLNCSSYYICVNGKVELHVCAAGSIYSDWFKICLDVSIVGKIALQFCKIFPSLPPITLPPLQNTTVGPEIGNDICPVEHALLPNPIDCSTYYECINQTPILQSCPSGMEYSCWNQKCVNATDDACIVSVGSVGKTCPKNGLKVADVQNCGNYYECSSGKIVLRHCFIGLQFNEKFQKCMFPSFAHCKTITTTASTPVTPSTAPVTISPDNNICPNEGALLPNPVNCSTYYKCVNSTPVLQLCAAGLEYSCWEMTCMAPSDAKCITTGTQVGQKCKENKQTLEDPDNCQQYYQCVDKRVELKKCPFNGYYNKWFKTCVPLAILAHCQVAPKPPTTSATTTTTEIPPQITNDICPVDGALIPNPTNCNGYYKCENNTPVPQNCPDGQEYSCWDQTCEKATSSQCIAVGSQRGQKCTREGVRLQNIDSCGSYFMCHNGVVEQNYCFIGFEYNRWYQKCTFALYSHCKTSKPITKPPKSTTEAPATTVKYPNSVCPKDGAKVPNPNDCQSYFVCEHSTPVLHTCPDNYNYDCWDQKCNLALISRCVNTPNAHVGDLCTKEGETVPNVVNCRKYYACQNGIIVDKTCSFLYQYSVWNNRCMPIGLAKCANNKFLGII